MARRYGTCDRCERRRKVDVVKSAEMRLCKECMEKISSCLKFMKGWRDGYRKSCRECGRSNAMSRKFCDRCSNNTIMSPRGG